MEKIRGFEIAKGWENKDINLPQRSTKHAAGYDFEAGETEHLFRILLCKHSFFHSRYVPACIPVCRYRSRVLLYQEAVHKVSAHPFRRSDH